MPKKKILFIDDNEEYRTSLKEFIFKNQEVDEASSTDQGLEMARKKDYDLILTDKDLEDNYGKKGGIHLAKTLRKEGYKKPIILSSASLEKEDKEELETLNVEAYSKIDLTSKLRKKLEG